MGESRVLGVDACRTGWIALSAGTVTGHAAPGISDLVEEASSAGPLAVIAIDIPIGLPDTGRSPAEFLPATASMMS
jgi:predicted RNase H-like nuclease